MAQNKYLIFCFINTYIYCFAMVVMRNPANSDGISRCRDVARYVSTNFMPVCVLQSADPAS